MYINGFPEPMPPGYGSSFINDYLSAMCFRALTGIGMGGTYMPGLKLVAEKFPSSQRGRAIGTRAVYCRQRHQAKHHGDTPKLTDGLVNWCPSVGAMGAEGMAVNAVHVPSGFLAAAQRTNTFGCAGSVLSSVIFGMP